MPALRHEIKNPAARARRGRGAAGGGAACLILFGLEGPEEALSDGRQALTCGEFARLARRVQALTALLRQEE